MRVEVKIPGGVESYCIDERGDKRVASDSLWLETFLCGVLRAYSYADDGSGDTIKKIIGVRRFDPITTTDVEHRFLDAAEKLFYKGWQLGSDPEIQVPNLVSNHLTTGLLKYIHTTGRYTSGINLFEKLRNRNPEISSLLAKVLIAGDEEVRAIQLLKEAIEELPMDYCLLDCQASFLQRKGNLDWALPLAQRAVVAAPSEFATWARLAEIYVGLEKWDLALLTLNSCPMFTYQDKDSPRMPEPARVNLPLLPDTNYDEINESVNGYDENVNPNLRRLTAGNQKGTFLKAYSLLTDITSKIGWDQLLRIRSQVFVMEEEYRSERSQPGTGKTTGKLTNTGRTPSTTALRAPSPQLNGRTSTSTAPEDSDADEDKSPKSSSQPESSSQQATDDTTIADSLEAPKSTVAATEANPGNEDTDPTYSDYTHFNHKRLCERWLDNLFMVLYEDLRMYTIWRADTARAKAAESNTASPSATDPRAVWNKSAEEWEILGDLAERLHHQPEAAEAFDNCLKIRFSPKAMRVVTLMYEAKRKADDTLQGLIRLIAWQYRWYSEVSLIFCLRNYFAKFDPVLTRSSTCYSASHRG